ncbi:MgtC/SapB family protein [Bradyrhizobium sp. WSM3983]|uniref:MgtC/SapB family protein n=1 Tax=Bradyrhizobium sp. WSM3983 TaxID=1038867 RepID=UPI0009FF75BD
MIPRLAVALGIGLLIGLERGWRRRQASLGSRAPGIRTFAISGLLGGVIAALALALSSRASAGAASAVGGIVLGLGFAAYAAVVTLFTRDENRAVGTFSATTAIAGMLTFALGAYALLGDLRIAAGTTVAAAGLLAFREELHGWLENITWPEFQ